MKFVGQYELGQSQGAMIARRRVRERRVREMTVGGGGKVRFEWEDIEGDGPREIYNVEVGTANGHRFEGHVFFQEGYFCVVCALDGVEVARREDLWSLEAASTRLKIEQERVLRQIQEWAQMPLFGLR